MIQRLEPLSLLRSHIERRSDRSTEYGQLLGVVCLVLHAAEVENLYDIPVALLAEKHVVWLEIAMHKLLLMRRIETRSQLGQHADNACRWKHTLTLERAA